MIKKLIKNIAIATLLCASASALAANFYYCPSVDGPSVKIGSKIDTLTYVSSDKNNFVFQIDSKKWPLFGHGGSTSGSFKVTLEKLPHDNQKQATDSVNSLGLSLSLWQGGPGGPSYECWYNTREGRSDAGNRDPNNPDAIWGGYNFRGKYTFDECKEVDTGVLKCVDKK